VKAKLDELTMQSKERDKEIALLKEQVKNLEAQQNDSSNVDYNESDTENDLMYLLGTMTSLVYEQSEPRFFSEKMTELLDNYKEWKSEQKPMNKRSKNLITYSHDNESFNFIRAACKAMNVDVLDQYKSEIQLGWEFVKKI